VVTEKTALVDVLGRDVFEANTGNLWPTVEGRPYCRALRDLAELYEQIGWKEENRVCLSMAAIYYNRLLVENRGDHQCIRLVYPFSLMSLSKFQISYNVLRHLINFSEDQVEKELNLDFKPKAYWLFNGDEDLFENVMETRIYFDDLEFAHLVALIVLKAILVKSIEENDGPIKLSPSEKRYGDEQKAVLRGYMLALRRTNSHAHAVLAGVVPLDDFLRRPFPQLVAVGTADEAREALGHAAYVIKKFHVLDVVKEVLLQ
jgi:hypothetical protein